MRRRALLAAVLLVVFAAPVTARDASRQAMKPKLEGEALVSALRKGGYTILLRHMATEPVAPDPDIFDVRDCSTQRGLSAQGRRQAEQVHEAIAKLGIRVSQVLSSPYCRCLETAKLAFGRVEENEILSVADQMTVAEKSERGKVVRNMLATAPASGTNTVLITHTGTLLYSFGLQTRPEGIAHVFQPLVGQALYVGSLEPEDWPRLAGLGSETP